MSILGNPGIVTITSAYSTANPVVPAAVSSNGYALGAGLTTRGSASPTAPAFDGVTIAALLESQDVDGNFWFVMLATGASVPQDLIDNLTFQIGDTEYQLFSDDATFDNNVTVTGYSTWQWQLPASAFGTVSQVVAITLEDKTDDFNCDCETGLLYTDESGNISALGQQFSLDTLQNLRRRMAIRLGYAAQADNLPDGIVTFINEYLYDAQLQLDKKFRASNMERFFRWTMVPGQRYYGLSASEGGCDLLLNPNKITWVGFEDLNKAWYNLIEGIPPEFYTRANINFGWPARYEIRSCLEIFPAPQAAYTLWVKGQFGLRPFASDTDVTSFDAELIFLLALGNAKLARGQGDAQAVLNQATTYFGAIVAGRHATARYIPKTRIQNPATPPRFLPLGMDQA
jgi:hypothetical protein